MAQQLTIVFWDVQHGNATYISTPNGKTFAIDLGVGSFDNSDETFSPLRHLKTRLGVNSLDGVVITHPHTDHLDDIFNFDSVSPRVLLRPKQLTGEEIRAANQSKAPAVVERYLEISARYNSPVSHGENPFEATVNGGVVFQRFFPKNCGRSNLNNHSIVAVVSYAGSKVLIPGDNETPSWEELLSDPNFVTAIRGTDILLAPHHGREAGFCEQLFKHISPCLTIVSDGSICDTSARDRYRARSSGWKVYDNVGNSETRYCLSTGCDGTVRIQIGTNTDGRNFRHVRIYR